MPTSKRRMNIPLRTDDLQFPEEGDMDAYVIFTQLKDAGPHIYAGWVNAPDDEMALHFACEHYGQDQVCVNIWAIPREAIGSTESALPTSSEAGPLRTFEIFTQQNAGDQYVSVDKTQASNSQQALEQAKQTLPNSDKLQSIWVAPQDMILITKHDEVIWRLTNQDYRMARGYAKNVRSKWEKIRAERDLKEYEKEDLKEMF